MAGSENGELLSNKNEDDLKNWKEEQTKSSFDLTYSDRRFLRAFFGYSKIKQIPNRLLKKKKSK